MNKIKYLIAIAAVLGALQLRAEAHLEFKGFTAFDNPNSPEHNLEVLGSFLGIDTTGFTLTGNFENLNGADTTINVTPGDYIVAHYGGQHGGSFEFFQVVGGETQVTVPGDPNPADNLANQNSLSSVRVFSGPQGVPDGGATVMLLGAALGSLGVARRYLKR